MLLAFIETIISSKIIMLILSGLMSIVSGVLVFLYTRKVKANDTWKLDIESKMESIPTALQEINVIKEALPELAEKKDFSIVRDEMRSGFDLLHKRIDEIDDNTDSIVKEAPDKYQTKTQCQQNIRSMTENTRYVRDKVDKVFELLLENKNGKR